MKIVFIIFVFLAFTLAKILVINESTESPSIIFPTFDAPALDFIDLSAGCGGFVDCLEYIGAVIYNIGLGLIFLVLFIIELVGYIFELFALLINVTFTGVDGAPFWINALMTTPFLAAIAFILYKLIRKGSSED